MKTKNILKIAIFSIALFALLISPVLKFNSSQVRAEQSKCEKEEGTCVAVGHGLPGCKGLEGYIESSLSCVGAGGGKIQCCIENPQPGTSQVGQRGLMTIKSRLPEERPEGLCKKNFEDGMLQCQGRYDFFSGGRFGCEFKVVIADMWCVTTKAILEGLGKMFSGLINLEIGWILWALDPGTYGGFAENEGVIQIWEIMRNLVNSLLVLGLIGIAIATILGYKKYAWKQILWKLILVALLVNFSLVISGIVVDISNYLSGYFLSIAQEENDTLAPRIQKGFGYVEEGSGDTKTLNPADIFNEKKYELPKILGFDTVTSTTATTTAAEEVTSYDLRFGNFFIIGFILIIVGGFAVISLLAIFLTILFRAFILIVLLGLSPIVFAAWIFPDTEKYWKMWWEQFIKWCFFPAIFSFTLYIAVIAMSQMSQVSIGADSATQTIIQMVLFSMFLVGGLIFSIQGGGVVSKIVMQQSSKAGAAIGAGIAKRTTRGIEGSKAYRAAGQKLTQIPLLNNLGYNMLDKSDSARTIGDIKKREKEIEENRSKDQILNTANGMAPNRINKKSYADYMATRNVALKKGWLKNDDKAVGSIGRDIENNNPDLDAKIIRNAFPQFFRIGANGKAEKIDQTANDYQDQVVNNLKKMSPTDLPKNTEKIITAAGGDINKFLGKLVQLKTNQFRAFLDNVGENEYNQGEKVFGGTPANPKPFYGPNGEIVKRLKTEAATTLAAYSNVTNSNGTPTSASGLSQLDVDKLEQKWIEADQVLTVLNDKLKTSDSLKETLGIFKI